MSKLGCLALRHLFQLGDFFDIHFQKQDISMLDASYDVPYLGYAFGRFPRRFLPSNMLVLIFFFFFHNFVSHH